MPLRAATNAMATRWELVLSGDNPRHLRAVADAAIDELHLWHHRLSRFQPDSLLAHINRTAATTPVPVDEDVWSLLSLCETVWNHSGGAFDPTLRSVPGNHWADLVRLDPDARTIRLTHPDASLDLGAVAKGFALDRVAELVRAHGVTSAFIHGGTSSAVAIGHPDDADAWRVAIRSDAAPITVELLDQSLGVSAPRGRRTDGRSHILEPSSGAPAEHADTAAVIAGSAALADAWSTALVVLGDRPAGMPHEIRSFIHRDGQWSVPEPNVCLERV